MRVFKHLPSPAIPERDDETEFVVDVGSNDESRRFRFKRSLPQPPLASQPSKLLKVQIPRPLGLVFERDRRNGHLKVAEILPNGNADKQRKLGAFIGSSPGKAVQEGDVLVAFTTTTFEYGTLGLLGAEKPRKARVLFGVPPAKSIGKFWDDITGALRSDQLVHPHIHMRRAT